MNPDAAGRKGDAALADALIWGDGQGRVVSAATYR
jgi:hypothetical protein